MVAPVPANGAPWWRRNGVPQIAFAVLSLAGALLVYWPALRGGLLWDDAGHVTRPEMQSLHGLWRTWFDLGATAQYYPLLHSAFWLEHKLWGDAVVGYHLTNVVLHALVACLLVLVLRRLAVPAAWLAGRGHSHRTRLRRST
jgi:hypothetical protein